MEIEGRYWTEVKLEDLLYDSKTARYYIVVYFGDLDINTDQVEANKQDAADYAMKKALEQLERGDESIDQHSGKYRFEEYYIDIKPNTRVKYLISVDKELVESQLQEYPTFVSSYDEDISQASNQMVFMGETISDEIKLVADTVESFHSDVKAYSGEVKNLNLKEDSNNIRAFYSKLKEFCDANGISIDGLKESKLSLGYDDKYELKYVLFESPTERKKLTKGLENFKQSKPVTSDRTLSYLFRKKDLQSLDSDVTWTEFVEDFTRVTPEVFTTVPAEEEQLTFGDENDFRQTVQTLDELPFKTTDEKVKEDKQLSNPSFKAKVYERARTTDDYVGSPVLQDKMAVLDSITDLNSLYDNLLNRISLQSLASEAKQCINPILSPADLETVASEIANHGQDVIEEIQNLPETIDNAADKLSKEIERRIQDAKDRLEKFEITIEDLPTINIPDDLPIVDFMKYIGEALESAVISALVTALLFAIRQMFESITELCETKDADQAGTVNLNQNLSSEVQAILKDSDIGNVSATSVSALIEDVSAMMSPTELCRLISGKSSEKDLFLIREIVKIRYQDLAQAGLDRTSKIDDLFKLLGKYVDKDTCNKISKVVPLSSSVFCSDSSFEEHVRTSLEKRGCIDPVILEKQVLKAKERLTAAFKNLSKIADNPKSILENLSIPSGTCQDSRIPGTFKLTPTMPDSVEYMTGKTLETVFEPIESSFKGNTASFIESLHKTQNYRKRVPFKFAEGVNNPEINILKSLGVDVERLAQPGADYIEIENAQRQLIAPLTQKRYGEFSRNSKIERLEDQYGFYYRLFVNVSTEPNPVEASSFQEESFYFRFINNVFIESYTGMWDEAQMQKLVSGQVVSSERSFAKKMVAPFFEDEAKKLEINLSDEDKNSLLDKFANNLYQNYINSILSLMLSDLSSSKLFREANLSESLAVDVPEEVAKIIGNPGFNQELAKVFVVDLLDLSNLLKATNDFEEVRNDFKNNYCISSQKDFSVIEKSILSIVVRVLIRLYVFEYLINGLFSLSVHGIPEINDVVIKTIVNRIREDLVKRRGEEFYSQFLDMCLKVVNVGDKNLQSEHEPDISNILSSLVESQYSFVAEKILSELKINPVDLTLPAIDVPAYEGQNRLFNTTAGGNVISISEDVRKTIISLTGYIGDKRIDLNNGTFLIEKYIQPIDKTGSVLKIIRNPRDSEYANISSFEKCHAVTLSSYADQKITDYYEAINFGLRIIYLPPATDTLEQVKDVSYNNKYKLFRIREQVILGNYIEVNPIMIMKMENPVDISGKTVSWIGESLHEATDAMQADLLVSIVKQFRDSFTEVGQLSSFGFELAGKMLFGECGLENIFGSTKNSLVLLYNSVVKGHNKYDHEDEDIVSLGGTQGVLKSLSDFSGPYSDIVESMRKQTEDIVLESKVISSDPNLKISIPMVNDAARRGVFIPLFVAALSLLPSNVFTNKSGPPITPDGFAYLSRVSNLKQIRKLITNKG